MKELISIDIGFENCEVVTIPVEHIKSIGMYDIVSGFYKGWYDNKALETEKANETVIVLSPTANYLPEQGWFHEGWNLFKRIQKYNDITDIQIQTSDGNKRRIATLWHEEDDEINRYQTTNITKDGYLVIVVSQTKTAEQIMTGIDR